MNVRTNMSVMCDRTPLTQMQQITIDGMSGTHVSHTILETMNKMGSFQSTDAHTWYDVYHLCLCLYRCTAPLAFSCDLVEDFVFEANAVADADLQRVLVIIAMKMVGTEQILCECDKSFFKLSHYEKLVEMHILTSLGFNVHRDTRYNRIVRYVQSVWTEISWMRVFSLLRTSERIIDDDDDAVEWMMTKIAFMYKRGRKRRCCGLNSFVLVGCKRMRGCVECCNDNFTFNT